MGRAPRLKISDITFHVVQRGHDRNRVFFGDDDFRAYLYRLSRVSRRHETVVHAYVLMTNHVHLLMTSGSPEGISRTMHDVAGTYARRINEQHGRTGALWETRFSSSPVDREFYCLACYRYIELNPVRAGMVASPADYRWSSYHENIGRRALRIVTPHACYLALGRSRHERAECYRSIVHARLPEKTIDTLRRGTRRNAPIGRDAFVRNIEQTTGLSFAPARRGRPPAND